MSRRRSTHREAPMSFGQQCAIVAVLVIAALFMGIEILAVLL